MARDYASILLVTKGHAFAHDAFLEMFEDVSELELTLVQQPAAQVLLRPEHIGDYDAVLFYDMSGIPGSNGPRDAADRSGDPPDDYRRSIEALLERGTGIVMLNHGLVSWPMWPLWREISGTSFLLRAEELDGQALPGSGYRGGHGPLPNATISLKPASPGHPVLEGLEDGFSITDELYLKSPIFEDRVTSLLRGDYDFLFENFSPPPLAPPAEQETWTHPPGSDLMVWAKATRNSPVVASELGDGPEAFANPHFRRLLRNSLVWVASDEARSWARSITTHQNSQ